MKNILKLTALLLSTLLIFAGCTFQANTSDNKKEEKPVIVEDDVPATQTPFAAALCTVENATLTFTNGNWKIVDIAEGTIFTDKTISDVSYNNGKFNCSSVVSKVDFPRKGMSEENVNYESFYSQLKSSYNVRLSHGYVTDDKIVLIVEERTSLFEEVYLAQLNAISGTPNVTSNPAGTKYVIAYTGNGYLQYIYVYKENAEEDLGYTKPELPESVGTAPFKGKSFANDNDKYVFGTDGTFSYYSYMGKNTFSPRYKTAYTYNADTKLLTFRYIAVPNENNELVTFNEYKQTITSKINKEMENSSEEQKKAVINSMVSMTKEEFEKTSIYKAELINGNLSLQTDYFTEVPDIKDLFLTNVSFDNNVGFEMIINFYGESRMALTGSLGTINFYITRTYDTSTDEMQGLTSETSDERFNITEITDTEIKANGTVEIFWDGPHRNEEMNLSFTYNATRNTDGTLTFTISGNDDVTKAELGATTENPNPTYELRSAGAIQLDYITK